MVLHHRLAALREPRFIGALSWARAPQGWACLGSTGVAGLVLELGLRKSGQVFEGTLLGRADNGEILVRCFVWAGLCQVRPLGILL